jgi:Bacterial membrane protein YfhO
MATSHDQASTNRVPWEPLRLLAWIVPVLALVYARPLWFGAVFFRRDIARYIHPIYVQTRARLSAGELPLWSRGEFGGMPMLGDVTNAVLYPPNLALLWLSPAVAITVLIVGHHLLAALGVGLLLRRWDVPTPIAAAFGLCFSLSGYAVGMDNSMTYLVGMSWGPWVLFALDRLLARPSLRRALPLALIYVCLFTSGELQFTYLSALLAGAYALLVARPVGPGLKWFALAGAFALGLSAIQLFPLIPVMLQSTRAGGLSVAEAQTWALHPLRLLELFNAHPFGVLAEQTFWGQAWVNSPGHTTPWANGLYMGVTLPLLALSAPRDRISYFLLSLSLLAVLLAMGPYTPLDGWFRALVPLWSSFRYPEKLVSLLTLALCLCAARGLAQTLEQPASRPALLRCSGATLLLLSVAALLWLWPEAWLSLIEPTLLEVRHVSPGGALSALRESATRSAEILLIATILLVVGRHSLRRTWLTSIWTVLLVVDVASANLRLNEFAPAEIYDAPLGVADAIVAHEDASQPARLARFALHFDPPPAATLEQLNLVHQHWLRQTLAAKSAVERGLRYATGYSASMSQDAVHSWERASKVHDGRELDLMAVRYLVDGIRRTSYSPAAGDAEIASFPELDVRVVARREPAAMARVVYEVHHVSAQAAAFEQLAAQAFDVRNTAIVEARTPLKDAAATPVPATPARYSVDKDEEQVIEAQASQPGLLVIAQTYDPSWRATVDGREAALLRVNAMQQGVLLTAGLHEVRLRYRAPGLLWGTLVSVATLLLVCIAWWKGRLREAVPGV